MLLHLVLNVALSGTIAWMVSRAAHERWAKRERPLRLMELRREVDRLAVVDPRLLDALKLETMSRTRAQEELLTIGQRWIEFRQLYPMYRLYLSRTVRSETEARLNACQDLSRGGGPGSSILPDPRARKGNTGLTQAVASLGDDAPAVLVRLAGSVSNEFAKIGVLVDNDLAALLPGPQKEPRAGDATY